MTDETEKTDEKLSKPWQFKRGYDPRRWMKGAPKKPKDKKKAEELIEHLIWDVLSEEITNPTTGEKVDRLRAMLRSMTTSRQSADKQAILDRILGKVMQAVDVTSAGQAITSIKVIWDDTSGDTPTETP